MKIFAKYYFTFVLVFIFILHFILDKGLGIENYWIRFGITLVVIILFIPRKKIVKTPTGEKIHITWIFLKEPIIID